MNCYEQSAYAEKKARERRSNSKRGKGKFSNDKLRGYVIHGLRDLWSPEDISNRIKEIDLSISAKGIYSFIRRERRDLTALLCYEGKPRRARVKHRRSQFRTGVPSKRSITERPEAVMERREVGHMEIDTVHSIRGISSAILTIIERVTRRTWWFILPDKTAESVNRALLKWYEGLANKPLTITSDNGPEFAELWKLERLFGIPVYYSEPYKSWQRGSSENGHRRLRRIYPKGTDFTNINQEALSKAEQLINNKPMRLLGYLSPAEVFADYLKAA
jgi:IS30 family transposase